MDIEILQMIANLLHLKITKIMVKKMSRRERRDRYLLTHP